MGARVGGFCYSSQVEANDAFYSAVSPSHAFDASIPAWHSLVPSQVAPGSWQTCDYVGGTSTGCVAVPVLTFPSCDMSEYFADGVTVGWGIAGAAILAACIKLIYNRRANQ